MEGKDGMDRMVSLSTSFFTLEEGCLMKRFFLAFILAITSASVAQATLFLADYDGDTGNGGLDADFAVGSTVATAANGAISATAKWGAGAIDPSGETELLSYATAGNFNLSAGTIEMWIRTDTWNTEWGGFFNAYIDNSNDIRFWKRNDGRLQAYMDSGADGWNLWGPVLNLGSDWYHLAWTWDSVADTTTMYLDGVPQASSLFFSGVTTAIEYTGTVDANFEVGAAQNGLEFQGQIDDFRISATDLYGGQSFTPPTGPYVIPEPGSLSMLAMAALMVLGRRRRELT